MINLDRVTFYQGDYKCFSNAAPFTVKIRGEIFETAEHAYQDSAFAQFPHVIALLKRARNACEAKMIGQQYADRLKLSWGTAEKCGLMKPVLRAKCAQHRYVRTKLLMSEDLVLIEASPDPFWGWGCDGNGQNNLGKIWMELRDELRSRA